MPGGRKLFHVADTGNSLGFQLGMGESGQQHRGEYRDNRDDHEKFDQCEGLWKGSAHLIKPVFRATRPERHLINAVHFVLLSLRLLSGRRQAYKER